MEDKINVLKKVLEQTKTFKYWSNKVNLTFCDFDIYDMDTGVFLQEGKKDIGTYCIFLKDNKINSITYDKLAQG